jgi:hypothetical protein
MDSGIVGRSGAGLAGYGNPCIHEKGIGEQLHRTSGISSDSESTPLVV